MLARTRKAVRSRPGRSAALAVVALLASGAVVAALGGVSGSGDRAQREASSSPTMASPTGSGAAPTVAGRGAVGAPVAPVAGAADPASPAALPSEAKMAAGGATRSSAEPQAPVSPGVGPGGLGGQPVPAAVAAGTARIVKNATLDVTVKKDGLGESYQRAADAAAAAGGWVQASQTSTDQATLTLKVPSDKLEGVVGAIRNLGKVTSVSESGEDVTAEFIDLDARIAHWRAQEAVFVGLMARAKTIPETIQIQQQLSTIQGQIEQLEGRRKYLDGQTSFSTIRLALLAEGAAAKPEPGPKPASTLARAWHRSTGAALAVLGGTIVVLGVVLPLAAVFGIPAWIAAVVLRRRRPALTGSS